MLLVLVACAARTVGDNPFLGGHFYVNEGYQQRVKASMQARWAKGSTRASMERMLSVPSAFWVDRKAKIRGDDTQTLESLLSDAASKSPPPLVVVIHCTRWTVWPLGRPRRPPLRSGCSQAAKIPVHSCYAPSVTSFGARVRSHSQTTCPIAIATPTRAMARSAVSTSRAARATTRVPTRRAHAACASTSESTSTPSQPPSAVTATCRQWCVPAAYEFAPCSAPLRAECAVPHRRAMRTD